MGPTGPGQAGPGAAPAALRVLDAVALVLGIVIGAGIFRSPSAVAGGAASGAGVLGLWLLGGLVSLAGALCYAELATAWPHRGGDYHFIGRAFGRGAAFLFAWARLTVIPTGSVALLAFVVGDYLAGVLGRPAASAPIAALSVVALVALNVAGLRLAARFQNALTVLVVGGLVAVIVAGLAGPAAAAPAATAAADAAGPGVALVFALLAYGGWNEAAYASAEVRGGRRAVALALVASVGAVTVLYLLANVAYLRALGLEGVRGSSTVAADVLALRAGPAGAALVALVVTIAALTSANATLLLGSRLAWAFGREHHAFAPLGAWNARRDAPVNALLAQGGVALLLVGFGAASRRGFETMVAYTSPVFWAFFLLAGLSLFVLRRREPETPRPFRVPLYPLTPALFCLACGYLLYASVAHAGPGAVLGLAVLAAGLVPLWWSVRAQARRPAPA